MSKKTKFEHKNKTRGSIRVWKSDIFYNPDALIKRRRLFDSAGKDILVQTSACTKPFKDYLNQHGIDCDEKIVMIRGKRLWKKGDIEGLEYDSIKTIKGDHDHLRLNYSTFEEHGEEYLSHLILGQAEWLQKHKIGCGEYDGTLACIRGKCLSLEDLEKMQKKLGEYNNQ